ncbi:Uncharacterised protein [uncultured archaeon]|nr:Uncharacterised protein [uncultured archaeon]
MQIQKSWLIVWILLIVLLVLVFPKSCGRTDQLSKAIEYSCMGLNAPFFSNLNSNYNWCYGICLEKSIKQEIPTNQTDQSNPGAGSGFLSDFVDSIKKVALPLLLIFVTLGVIKFLSSLKGKKSIIVYRK